MSQLNMKPDKLEKQLDWCLRKGEHEGLKHKGLRQVLPDQSLGKAHLAKAVRNLEAISYFRQGQSLRGKVRLGQSGSGPRNV